jgi:hypothetical protein
MANNRMWLIHKDSGHGICLGKQMGLEFYNAPEKAELERFYVHLTFDLDSAQNPNNLVLAMEDCSGTSCFDDWCYTSETCNGFHVFKINETTD